jgi:hypothetical protein
MVQSSISVSHRIRPYPPPQPATAAQKIQCYAGSPGFGYYKEAFNSAVASIDLVQQRGLLTVDNGSEHDTIVSCFDRYVGGRQELPFRFHLSTFTKGSLLPQTSLIPFPPNSRQ